jgi:hypothetical protein
VNRQATTLGYRARQISLGLVVLAMVPPFILIDGRPRATFAFFAVLAIAFMVNVERLRRREQGAPGSKDGC